MFALSTAWNADSAKDGRTIAEQIFRLGINKIELNFSLTKNMVKEISQFTKKHKIEITSLHNFCPIPGDLDPEQALPDYFSPLILPSCLSRFAIMSLLLSCRW